MAVAHVPLSPRGCRLTLIESAFPCLEKLLPSRHVYSSASTYLWRMSFHWRCSPRQQLFHTSVNSVVGSYPLVDLVPDLVHAVVIGPRWCDCSATHDFLLYAYPTVVGTYNSKAKAPAKTAPTKAVFLRKRRLGCRLAIGARFGFGPGDGVGAGAGPMGVGGV